MKDQNDTNLRFIGAAAGGMGAPENPNDPDWPSRDPKLNTEVRLGHKLERDGGVRPGYLDGGAVRANAAQPVTQIAGQRLALLVAMMCVGGVGAVGEEASASGGAVGDVRMGDAGERGGVDMLDQTQPKVGCRNQDALSIGATDTEQSSTRSPSLAHADASSACSNEENTDVNLPHIGPLEEVVAAQGWDSSLILQDSVEGVQICAVHERPPAIFSKRLGPNTDIWTHSLYIIAVQLDPQSEPLPVRFMQQGWIKKYLWSDCNPCNPYLGSNRGEDYYPQIIGNRPQVNNYTVWVGTPKRLFQAAIVQDCSESQKCCKKFLTSYKAVLEAKGLSKDYSVLFNALAEVIDGHGFNTNADHIKLWRDNDLAARTSRIHLALREVYAEHAAKQAPMAQDTEPRPSAMRVDPTRA